MWGTCCHWAFGCHFRAVGKALFHVCMWQWLLVMAERWVPLPPWSAVYGPEGCLCFLGVCRGWHDPFSTFFLRAIVPRLWSDQRLL